MDDVSLIISFCRFVSSMHVELVVVVTLFVRIEHPRSYVFLCFVSTCLLIKRGMFVSTSGSFLLAETLRGETKSSENWQSRRKQILNK
jgi:hypothetical protein